MTDSKLYELVEGLNVNLTCRIKRNQMNPITWRKDGKLISMGHSAYINILETQKSSLLSLSDLKMSDSGNYSCQSQTENGTLSKWIFLKVRRKAETGRKEGTQVVADEPNAYCASLKCSPDEFCTWDRTGQRFWCSPSNPEAARKMNIRRQGLISPNIDLQDFSNSPHFDSVQSAGQEEAREDPFFASFSPQTVDFDKTTHMPHECADSVEGCNTPNFYDFGLDGTSKETAAVIGGPFPLIGIGSMCTLFLVIVLVSAFVIRRKIVRRQLEFSYNSARNRLFISPNQRNVDTNFIGSERRHQASTSGTLPLNKLPYSVETLQSPKLRIPRAIKDVRSNILPIEMKTLTANTNSLTEVSRLPTNSTGVCSLGNTQAFLQGSEIRTFDQQEVVYLENCLDVGNFLFIQPSSQLMDPQWMFETDNEELHQHTSSPSATKTACTSRQE